MITSRESFRVRVAGKQSRDVIRASRGRISRTTSVICVALRLSCFGRLYGLGRGEFVLFAFYASVSEFCAQERVSAEADPSGNRWTFAARAIRIKPRTTWTWSTRSIIVVSMMRICVAYSRHVEWSRWRDPFYVRAFYIIVFLASDATVKLSRDRDNAIMRDPSRRVPGVPVRHFYFSLLFISKAEGSKCIGHRTNPRRLLFVPFTCTLCNFGATSMCVA